MALRIPVGVETIVAHDRKSWGFIRACSRNTSLDSQQTIPARSSM
jgi:hypothetical protein